MNFVAIYTCYTFFCLFWSFFFGLCHVFCRVKFGGLRSSLCNFFYKSHVCSTHLNVIMKTNCFRSMIIFHWIIAHLLQMTTLNLCAAAETLPIHKIHIIHRKITRLSSIKFYFVNLLVLNVKTINFIIILKEKQEKLLFSKS